MGVVDNRMVSRPQILETLPANTYQEVDNPLFFVILAIRTTCRKKN